MQNKPELFDYIRWTKICLKYAAYMLRDLRVLRVLCVVVRGGVVSDIRNARK